MLHLDLFCEHPGRMKAKAIKTATTSCVIIYKCDAKETPIMRLYVTQADLRALATVASALNFAFNMKAIDENDKTNNTGGGEGRGDKL